jgi:hypothetical protein
VLAGKAQQPAVGDPTATWKKRGEPTALVDGGLPPDNSTLFLVIYPLQMAILYTLNCQRLPEGKKYH